MKFIQTIHAPAAIGPYSQAVSTESMLFVSGQLGINPGTGILDDTIGAQTQQALKNLDHVLLEAKMKKTNVVKTTIFLKNMADFQTVNEIYAGYFQDHKPARSTIEVAALPKNALIEVEAIAVK